MSSYNRVCPVDNRYFSSAVVPSHDLSAEDIDYWRKKFSDVEELWKEKLDERVFKLVVHNFKPHWKKH